MTPRQILQELTHVVKAQIGHLFPGFNVVYTAEVLGLLGLFTTAVAQDTGHVVQDAVVCPLTLQRGDLQYHGRIEVPMAWLRQPWQNYPLELKITLEPRRIPDEQGPSETPDIRDGGGDGGEVGDGIRTGD